MDRPTFSQSWPRVSKLTPTLRPEVQIHRQLYRGEPWHIVHDPIGNNFSRLNPVAYHYVGLLDGRRTVEEAWNLTLERFGDAAPTQNEVIGLLGQLNQFNLLRVDLPADAAQLLQRQRQRRIRQWGGQLMSILSLRFPLFNPDKMLAWLLPVFRPLLSAPGLVLWCAWLVFAAYIFIPEAHRFTTDLGSILDPSNWVYMSAIFILIKAWHELGHGLVCKRFGGAVPEVGIMFLVLFPAPFVDATSSWGFSDKWRRLLVGSAGMIFELSIAAAAAIIWVNSEDGTLARQLSRNVVVLSSITTILFNANPLLRFDGYYMLSDLLEVPNLYERSGRHLRWVVQRFAYGITSAQPVSTLPGERWILGTYGIGSQIYRAIIMFSISLLVASMIPALGVVIGLWAVISWAGIPTGKFLHWLITSPALRDHRARAVGVTAGTAAAVIVLVGMIKMPDHRRAEGIVESMARTDLTVQSDGLVTAVHVDSGQAVLKDQVIMVARNPALEGQKAELQAELDRLLAVQAKARATDLVQYKENAADIANIETYLKEVNRRLGELSLTSPQSGTLLAPTILTELEGRWLKKGQLIAQVADPRSVRITAILDQAANAAPFFDQIESVELRTAGRVDRVVPSRVLRVGEAGRSDLQHAALGYGAGGKVPTKPDDKKGREAIRPQFEVTLEWPQLDQDGKQLEAPPMGQRVFVRFTLATRRPWLFQWIHSLRQLIRDRLMI